MSDILGFLQCQKSTSQLSIQLSIISFPNLWCNNGLMLNILFIYILCAFLSSGKYCFVSCVRLKSFQKEVGDKNNVTMPSFKKLLIFPCILIKIVPCLYIKGFLCVDSLKFIKNNNFYTVENETFTTALK